jgi:hypothetical protein
MKKGTIVIAIIVVLSATIVAVVAHKKDNRTTRFRALMGHPLIVAPGSYRPGGGNIQIVPTAGVETPILQKMRRFRLAAAGPGTVTEGFSIPIVIPPFPAGCSDYYVAVFNNRATLVLGADLGEGCTELMTLDSGWWPDPDNIVPILWNADKGTPAFRNLTDKGEHDVKVQAASGEWIIMKTHMYSMPEITIAGHTFSQKGGIAAMTGELAGVAQGSVGWAFPRTMLTFDFMNAFAWVLSFARARVVAYPARERAYPHAKNDHPNLSPLIVTSSLPSSWGLFVCLEVGGLAKESHRAWFLVDTGALGITLMVTDEFAAALPCYDPPFGSVQTTVSGRHCSPVRRSCFITDPLTRAQLCLPVTVAPPVTGCPSCAGRVGMALLAMMDLFLFRSPNGTLGSAYSFTNIPSNAECSSVSTYKKDQCKVECAGVGAAVCL